MANSAASTLITRTLDNLSRASTGTTRSGDTLSNLAIDWLNRTMLRMSRKYDFREMYKKYSSATVDGQKSYAFPTNWKIIIDMTVIDGFSSKKLELVLPQYFDKVIPYPEQFTERCPTWYAPYGNNFDLYSIPDTAYTMYCRSVQWPTIITSIATLIDYEPNKDDIIVAGMTAEGFRHLQAFEDAAFYDKEFKERLAEAIDLEERLPDWDPVGRGFNSSYGKIPVGEYYNDPFIWRNP